MIKKFLNFKSYFKFVYRQIDLESSCIFFNRKNTAGFSMIELLVTIAILGLVSGSVFLNHSQFNNNILIRNLAYEISLAIRQAQSYGLQVKEFEGSFDEGYGVYFNSSSDEFIIFADIYPEDNPNYIYDNNSDEVMDTLKMTNKNVISDLCVTLGATKTCGLGNISIGFLRPNPTAVITSDSNSAIEYDSVEVEITSPKGSTKKVFVNRVGQISIQ